MTEFVSDIKTILHSNADIYRVLSDMSKLNLVKDQISSNKIEGFTFNRDSCSFKVNPIGEVKFDVVERQPNKLVKFKSGNLPFDVFLWIQLVPQSEKDTKMRLTVRADLNPFLKSIISQPMKEALDKIADMLTRLPYDSI